MSMIIPLSLDGFVSQKVSVETAGFWRGPRFLLNGAPVEMKKNKCVVKNDAGADVPLELKAVMFDPVPKVVFAGKFIELARPLEWYEWAWIGVPILLIFTGGGLGALFGIMATYASARIFRGDRSTGAKYALTGLVSFAALFAFLVLAIIIQIALGRA